MTREECNQLYVKIREIGLRNIDFAVQKKDGKYYCPYCQHELEDAGVWVNDAQGEAIVGRCIRCRRPLIGNKMGDKGWFNIYQ